MLLGGEPRDWHRPGPRCCGHSWALLKDELSLPAEAGGGGLRCPGTEHSDVCGCSLISAPDVQKPPLEEADPPLVQHGVNLR